MTDHEIVLLDYCRSWIVSLDSEAILPINRTQSRRKIQHYNSPLPLRSSLLALYVQTKRLYSFSLLVLCFALLSQGDRSSSEQRPRFTLEMGVGPFRGLLLLVNDDCENARAIGRVYCLCLHDFSPHANLFFLLLFNLLMLFLLQ